MRITEVTPDIAAGYCRLELPLDEADRRTLETVIMPAAKAHMAAYTGQSVEELAKHEELTVAFLALCSFLYDNRSFGTVTDQKQNEVIAGFLDGYNLNLMGWGV